MSNHTITASADAYYDTEFLKTLDDERLEEIWDQQWGDQTMLCEEFQALWDELDGNEKAGEVLKGIIHLLCYNNPFGTPGWEISEDGQDFIRISADAENNAFWSAFRARMAGGQG
jgi:hypothetical protein